MSAPSRCGWCGTDPLYVAYHDQEWGVPQHEEGALWTKLVLETFQAGLSWLTILRRREGLIAAFDGLDPERVARMDERRQIALLDDPRIIRHPGKVRATVDNARAYLALRARGETLCALLWSFAPAAKGARPFRTAASVPTRTPASAAMAKALRARGFRFVGPTNAYALMQATGMVNDHLASCFRYAALTGRT